MKREGWAEQLQLAEIAYCSFDSALQVSHRVTEVCMVHSSFLVSCTEAGLTGFITVSVQILACQISVVLEAKGNFQTQMYVL